MLHKKLPSIIRPQQLCQHAPAGGTLLSGTIEIGYLPNLSKDILSPGETPVTVTLTFSMDTEGFCCIEGQLSADIVLTCQRCLQPMVFEVRNPIKVSPVVSFQQAERLNADYEPLIMQEGEISMAEWIAEELHLALPLAPRHEPPCAGLGDQEAKNLN